jgi:pimeloyl-ACP methyl ester carboxylesterase
MGPVNAARTGCGKLRSGSERPFASRVTGSSIIVMPQTPSESIWRGTVAEMSLAALEQTTKEFRADRNRTYVVGLSMGGYGAWTLALKHPTKFAAIVAVCGGILPPSHLTQLDAGLREEDPYAELARRLGSTPKNPGAYTRRSTGRAIESVTLNIRTWATNPGVRRSATRCCGIGYFSSADQQRTEEGNMDDDRILRVLEEMRDLQRQSTANYQLALRNQEESIKLQQQGLRRVRVILGIATVALVIVVGMLVMLLLRALARLP